MVLPLQTVSVKKNPYGTVSRNYLLYYPYKNRWEVHRLVTVSSLFQRLLLSPENEHLRKKGV